MSGERRLVSMRRRVPRTRQARYGELWNALAAEAGKVGAHAWRFVAPGDRDLHLEFLEYKTDADPRAAEETRRILRQLDEEAVADVEEWMEAR